MNICQTKSAIDVRSLTHRYPSPARRHRSSHSTLLQRPALDQLTLSVPAGQLFGILGPNGGGKTTLFRILTTLLRPTEGQVRIFDCDTSAQPHIVRTLLGVVFQSPSLDNLLTARENLRHQGHLYSLTGSELTQTSEDWLNRLGVLDRADEPIERLSGGMRRRVELAKAMIHQPRLLLLDEPTVGLDPGSRAELWRHLIHLRQSLGVTIVLTTHLMDEAERCDRLAILHQGRLVALDTPNNLKASIPGQIISIEPASRSMAEGIMANDSAVILTKLIQEQLPQLVDSTHGFRIVEGKILLEHERGIDLIAPLAMLLGDKARSITLGQPSLEDVFLHLTGHRLQQYDDD